MTTKRKQMKGKKKKEQKDERKEKRIIKFKKEKRKKEKAKQKTKTKTKKKRLPTHFNLQTTCSAIENLCVTQHQLCWGKGPNFLCGLPLRHAVSFLQLAAVCFWAVLITRKPLRLQWPVRYCKNPLWIGEVGARHQGLRVHPAAQL